MINTISKTLGAQEKTQDIKRTKIETKQYVRSRRNELTEVIGYSTERCPYSDQTLRSVAQQQKASAAATGRTDGTVHHPGNRFSTDQTLAANRPDAGNAASDRVQRGSRAAKLRPDASGGM